MNCVFRTAVGIFLASVIAASAQADVLVFKTGERREGRVEDMAGEPSMVLLIMGTMQLPVPRDRIEEIVEHDDAQDYTILGGQFLEAGNYERAVQMYQQALRFDPDHGDAEAGLTKARRLIEERQQSAERQQLEQHSAALEQVRELMEQDSQDAFTRAEEILDRIIANTASEEQRTAATVAKRDLYLEWAKFREDRLDRAGAEELLVRVLQFDPQNREAQDLLLTVWENDPTKRQQVLEIYRERLQENPDDLELTYKYARQLLHLNKYQEAVEPLKRLHDSGNYTAYGIKEDLIRAMKQVSASQAQQGNTGQAIATFQELLGMFPEVDSTPLHYLQYEQQLNKLEADDWEGRAALLDNLVANGLTSYAYEEAEQILRRDPDNKKAGALLRERAVDQLAEVQGAMARGEFTLAKTLAQSFAERHTRFPELVQTASDIYAKASVEAERQAKRVREQAREIVAQADAAMSEARRYIELLKSADNPNRSSVMPYRSEAQRMLERAIRYYGIALELDPSVGPLVGGLDVDTKLRDAKNILRQFKRDPITVRYPQGTG